MVMLEMQATAMIQLTLISPPIGSKMIITEDKKSTAACTMTSKKHGVPSKKHGVPVGM